MKLRFIDVVIIMWVCLFMIAPVFVMWVNS